MTRIPLMISRHAEETWRDAVERTAKAYGLEHECLEEFDEAIARGEEESRAAWCALYEWDCLDWRP